MEIFLTYDHKKIIYPRFVDVLVYSVLSLKIGAIFVRCYTVG